MNVHFKVLFILLLPVAKCDTQNKDFDDITSEEQSRYDAGRFDKDLNDEEWHVAHLNRANVKGRRHCAAESFQDRIQRYRKALRNDGALVKFVSYEPIPFNVSDVINSDDTCKPDDLKDQKTLLKQNTSTPLPKTEAKPPVTKAYTTNDIKNTTAALNASEPTSPVSKIEQNYQATTPIITVTDDRSKEDDDIEKEKESKSRRGSEYMFSSVEYYDEVPNFDPSVCPDAVDVIELELDELRSYDLECERMIEWRSLLDIEF